ncbi:hypothetical protein SAGO17_0049 [Mimivirus AB-566-O17]|uniref:Uncharacterized protein n=1 Tax=Mimivirus AB-566-O17 TaxID=1988039 RepID=A0A1X9VNS8_9VIRU|nr:hypothetical protein SAGO17_0049 [Mimivirus AB-566-O17]
MSFDIHSRIIHDTVSFFLISLTYTSNPSESPNLYTINLHPFISKYHLLASICS